MQPFRKNLAIAIDGGGIRGVVVTKALTMLEAALGQPLKESVRLTTGTSTGSIISAGIAAGLTAARIHELYLTLGTSIFKTTWRSAIWPLTKYRYESAPLEQALREVIGDLKMGDFWKRKPPLDVVITAFDLQTNKSCFIKPWKSEYADWPVVKAVMASSSAPTFFPPVEGRYVDGGVGAYYNPCFLAAYEAQYCLKWEADDTTLISIGTGRNPPWLKPGEAANFWAWQWLGPIEDGFLDSTDDQQVHLVETFFPKLDFCRYQVDLKEPIDMDKVGKIDELVAYGEQLGGMILSDQHDRAMGIRPAAVKI